MQCPGWFGWGLFTRKSHSNQIRVLGPSVASVPLIKPYFPLKQPRQPYNFTPPYSIQPHPGSSKIVDSSTNTIPNPVLAIQSSSYNALDTVPKV